MFDSRSIANEFLRLASVEQVRDMTPMKLIKLVYIAHGWHLGLTSVALINEMTEAWKYGPVVPAVYDEVKHYGSQPITVSISRSGKDYILNDEGIKPFLKSVWERYKTYNGIKLSAMTHKPETPWFITWHDRGGKLYRNRDIENDLIKDYYWKLNEAVKSGS